MSVSRPCMIKVKNGVFVNLSTSMSFAIEPGLAQEVPVLKEGADPKKKESYEMKIETADTVSFYFPNDRGLAFRVGYEIERKDYDRMKRVLNTLEFKEKKPNANGKSDSKPTTEGAK